MVGAAAVAGAAPVPSGLGRLMQGMAGVGGKLAPAFGVAKGAAQGAGAAAGYVGANFVAQPAKGILGFFVNFFPEAGTNVYGWFLWGAAFIYLIDWFSGFNTAATANLHLWFAAAAFLILGITGRFLSVPVAASGIVLLMSLYSFAQSDRTFVLNTFSVASLAVALFIYWRANTPGFFKYLPLFAFVDVYALPVFRDRLLEYVQNINYASFAVAFVTNRILFPLWLWFGIFAFSGETSPSTRVARKLLAVMIVFYLVVSTPQITHAYSTKVSGLTPEEKEVAQTVWSRFQTNVQRIVSGEFLKAPVASAYEGLERTFGFGEPKEQPKMGLQLRDDPNMPKVFDLNFYNAATPSLIMDVPNPFPADFDPARKVMDVVEVECKDNTGTARSGTPVEPSPKPSLEKPVKVSYKRPRTAKCEFSGLKEGSHTADITVKYKFAEDAELSTSFMRSDKLEVLIAAGEDPATVNKIPPAKAEYDNGPVAITWGPVELVTAPASVDLVGNKNWSLIVYVAKSGAWEGEISGIEELTLTVPDYVSLAKTDDEDKRCSFKSADGETNTYKVKDILIGSKSRTDPFKFVGDGVRFECETTIKPEILGGADWAGAQFKVNGIFVFAVKRSVTFDVEGCNKGETRTCLTEKSKCAGNQTCADGTWSGCTDWAGDECVEETTSGGAAE